MADEQKQTLNSFYGEREGKTQDKNKFGRLRLKCGYEFCDGIFNTRNELFTHIEEVHGIVRKNKPFPPGKKPPA